MPIVDVHIVGTLPPYYRRGLKHRLAASIANVMEASTEATWVTLGSLDADSRHGRSNGIPDESLPIFVTILSADLLPDDLLAEQAARVADIVAAACGRQHANVHLCYEWPAHKRVTVGRYR